jgi:uncharacterized membrane protein YkoI
MKKLFFALCMMMGTAVAVQAQDSAATTSPAQESPAYNSQDDEWKDKEPIAVAELPAAIRQQLQGTDFSGWTTSKAYRKMKDGKTVYAVELSKGGETKMVKFDADGNKIAEKEKKPKG